MIADIAPSSPPGTCDPGRSYFDIGTPAFTNLFRGGIGYGTATFRLVPAPVTGNMKLVSVIASGGYYFELRPYNHRAGVSKLEVQGSGGSWIELPRTAYNSFVYNTGIEMIFPMNVRVTSRFGEVVTFPPISSMAEGSRFTANSQFAVFPDQGSSPVWTLPPVYTDSFSNILGAQWTTSTYNGPSVTTTSSADAFEGTAALRISGLNAFSGVMFHSPLRFPRHLDGWFEFAIRSEGAAIDGLGVVISGIDADESAAQSTAISLPTIGSTWRRLRILLDPAQSPDEILQVQLMNPTGAALPSVLLDSIAFRW